MKFLVTIQISNDAGNAFVKTPHFAEKLQTIFADQKAENVYFRQKEGLRSVLYFTDVADASRLPSVLEPWWQLGASRAEADPVFTPQEMQKVEQDISAIAKKYGH